MFENYKQNLEHELVAMIIVWVVALTVAAGSTWAVCQMCVWLIK